MKEMRIKKGHRLMVWCVQALQRPSTFPFYFPLLLQNSSFPLEMGEGASYTFTFTCLIAISLNTLQLQDRFALLQFSFTSDYHKSTQHSAQIPQDISIELSLQILNGCGTLKKQHLSLVPYYCVLAYILILVRVSPTRYHNPLFTPSTHVYLTHAHAHI